MNDILFTEKQRFNQWWVWLIFIVLNSMITLGLYRQLYQGIPFGDNPACNSILILIACFIFFLTAFMFMLKLETEIKHDGIYVRFFPLRVKFKYFSWDNLSKYYVRKYSPIIEYGGWGYRWGISNGMAYNVSGNMGLQLEFKNGKKLLIGTKKPDELITVLSNINKQVPENLF